MSYFLSTSKKGIVAMIKALVGQKRWRHVIQKSLGGINYNSTQAA
jgi:hypothetical protein